MELALHEFPVMQMMQGSSTTNHTQNRSAVKHLDLQSPGDCRYIYNHKSCGLCGSAVRTWDMAARTCYACEVCQPLNKGTILDTSRSKALSAAKDSKVPSPAALTCSLLLIWPVLVPQPLQKGTTLDTSCSKALSAARDSKIVPRVYLSRVIWLRTHFT